MDYFWVTFDSNKPGTIATPDDAPNYGDNPDGALATAREVAAKFGDVRLVAVIPYPRLPKLHDIACPAFCYASLSKCAGKTACAQRPSCTS